MRRGLRALGLSVGLGVGSACSIDGSGDTDTDTLETATDGTSSSTSGAPPNPTTDDAASSSGSSSGSSTSGAESGSSSTSDGDDDGGGSGPPALGPACSVQEVTRGAEFNPLPRGGAGEFPFAVADELEDYCGCHTLGDNRQNVGWEFLRPPTGTLFLTHADLSRSYDGTSLHAAMLGALDNGMPPGSCPHPENPLATIRAWLEMGAPDAPNYPG